MYRACVFRARVACRVGARGWGVWLGFGKRRGWVGEGEGAGEGAVEWRTGLPSRVGPGRAAVVGVRGGGARWGCEGGAMARTNRHVRYRAQAAAAAAAGVAVAAAASGSSKRQQQAAASTSGCEMSWLGVARDGAAPEGRLLWRGCCRAVVIGISSRSSSSSSPGPGTCRGQGRQGGARGGKGGQGRQGGARGGKGGKGGGKGRQGGARGGKGGQGGTEGQGGTGVFSEGQGGGEGGGECNGGNVRMPAVAG